MSKKKKINLVLFTVLGVRKCRKFFISKVTSNLARKWLLSDFTQLITFLKTSCEMFFLQIGITDVEHHIFKRSLIWRTISKH